MFTPQQYAALAVVTPQAENSPTLTAAQACPPDTAIGVGLSVVVPLPSSPSRLSPQQYAILAVVTPQASPLPCPALTVANVSPPATATGVVLQAAPLHCCGPTFVPFPSSP